MTDHAPNRGKTPPQRALHFVDLFMHVGHRECGIDGAMKIDDLAAGFAHPYVMDLGNKIDRSRDFSQRVAHGGNAVVRRIVSGFPVALQRLDMRLHFDLRSKFVADRLLERAGDFVGATERQVAVDFEIE